MKYLPVENETTAKQISECLYCLIRPVKEPGQVTQYFCGWIIHPDNGNVVMSIDEQVSIKPNDNSEELAPVVTELSTLLDQELMVEPSQKVNAASLFGDDILNAASSREELQAQGWFKNEELNMPELSPALNPAPEEAE